MNLDAIINEMPSSEDIDTFQNYIFDQSDRSAAIMIGALVEQCLLAALRKRMPHITEDETKAWFLGSTAPFRSFEAKTRLARALFIYDENVEGRIDLIRKIRNAFAHRSLPLDFEHATLKPLVDQLNPTQRRDVPTKLIFCAYSLAIARLLYDVPEARPAPLVIGD